MKPVTHARYDPSTSNLNNHILSCVPTVNSDQSQIGTYTNGGVYNKGELRLYTVFWVSSCYRPYSIVMDKPFLDIVRTCNSNVKMVVDSTVSDDVIQVHKMSIPFVAKMLQDYAGFLHLSFDGWSARNVLSFLGITVHLVKDGKLVSFILDFVE